MQGDRIFWSFRTYLPISRKNVESPTLKVVITKRQHQNQFFDEMLTESLSLRMMQISAGSFLMGSPSDERDRSDSESPQHQVQVETFFLGKYPVTQAQWRFVAALSQVDRPLEADPSNFKGDDRPVENVSWHDATEFCARLSPHTGRFYRLPTEAEWEYACRAGTTTPFHFGETIATELANYRGTDIKGWSGSYGQGDKGEYRSETTPVDQFGIANDFGLCDMHGNVWEWCEDHWHDNYESAPADGSAWHKPRFEGQVVPLYVSRGGSWQDVPGDCRSASRNDVAAGLRYYTFGFRVVCFAPRTLQPSAL